MTIQLKHSTSSLIKEVKYGFSWTSVFFGPIVPLLRGDTLWFILWLILSGFSFFVFWLIFPFIYNKIYLTKLLSNGYTPVNKVSEDFLISKNLIMRKVNNETSTIKVSSMQKDINNQKITTDVTPINEETVIKEVNKSDNSQDIKQIIATVLNENNGRFKNVYSILNGSVTDKIIKTIDKQFPEINSNNEEILLYIEAFGSFFVVTNQNYHMRLVDYYLEMLKKNFSFNIETTNLLVEDDNLSGHALFKCINMNNPKKPLGCVVDMAYPLTKNKKEDVKVILESVYNLNYKFHGESAKRPAGLK